MRRKSRDEPVSCQACESSAWNRGVLGPVIGPGAACLGLFGVFGGFCRFIGYAEWPDQATWQKAFDAKMVYDDPEARAMFVDALEEDSRPGELIAAMEMLDDFLTLRSGPRA